VLSHLHIADKYRTEARCILEGWRVVKSYAMSLNESCWRDWNIRETNIWYSRFGQERPKLHEIKKITLSQANTSKGLIFEPNASKTPRISISLKAHRELRDTYNVSFRIHVCCVFVSMYIGLRTAGWMINAYSIQQICVVTELTGKI